MEQTNYAYAVFSSIDAMRDGAEANIHYIDLGQYFASHVKGINVGVETLVPTLSNMQGTLRVSLSDCDSVTWSTVGSEEMADECNPQLGVRGVSRFAQTQHKEQFAQECALIKALKQNGHDVEIVVPFVRTLSDAAKIIDLLAEQGLPRGLAGQKVLFRCDTPSAALLCEKLLHYFDGVVVNQQHLTQFTLAVDYDNAQLSYLFDTDNDSVVELTQRVIEAAERVEKPVQLTQKQWLVDGKLAQWLLEHPQVAIALTA